MGQGASEPTAVVLDTNVVVAALLWDGVPRQLLEAVASNPLVVLFSSPALLAELTRVLPRPQFQQRLSLSGKTIDELVASYTRLVTIVTPASIERVVSGDADDDHVLALAVAARASLIVSGDRAHLIPIGYHEGIAIITPREAMQVLR